MIKTSRLKVRAFSLADAAALVAYRCDPAVARYQSWDTDYSLEQAKEFIGQLIQQHEGTPGEWYQYAIANSDDDALLGDIGIYFDAERTGQVTVGFTLSAAAQGKGIAAEALSALLNYLRQEFDIGLAEAITDVRNTAAQKLLERTGFEKDQLLRHNGFYKGEWCDEIRYVRKA